MAGIEIPAALAESGLSYQLELDGAALVGALARYLAQYEAYLTAATLELARPLEHGQRLGDLDWQPGDRLLIFPQPATPQRLPARLRPGDKVLKLSRGDFEVSSRGKKGLLVGKPDLASQTLPDVDMRYFVAPQMLPFVSRGCLWLSFDEQRRIWYASKLGETRVMLDEYELGTERIALESSRVLRFYRPSDDPRHPASEAIGELRIDLEEVRAGTDSVPLREGGLPMRVHLGVERSTHTLRAASLLPVGEVVTRLALYFQSELSEHARAYLLRLLPPDQPLETMIIPPEGFLYAARSLRYAQTQLLLRDAHGGRIFALHAGAEDDARLIGCREEARIVDTALDVDLFEALAPAWRYDRRAMTLLRHAARLVFKADEDAWYIRLDEDARLPLFVNNDRASSATLKRLLTGDVLSFGPSPSEYYARLEVEIAMESE